MSKKESWLISGQPYQLCYDIHQANLLGVSYGTYMGMVACGKLRRKEAPIKPSKHKYTSVK